LTAYSAAVRGAEDHAGNRRLALPWRCTRASRQSIALRGRLGSGRLCSSSAPRPRRRGSPSLRELRLGGPAAGERSSSIGDECHLEVRRPDHASWPHAGGRQYVGRRLLGMLASSAAGLLLRRGFLGGRRLLGRGVPPSICVLLLSLVYAVSSSSSGSPRVVILRLLGRLVGRCARSRPSAPRGARRQSSLRIFHAGSASAPLRWSGRGVRPFQLRDPAVGARGCAGSMPRTARGYLVPRLSSCSPRVPSAAQCRPPRLAGVTGSSRLLLRFVSLSTATRGV